MVTDAILDFLYNLIGTVLGALPTITVPAWMDASGPLATVMTFAGSMGAWFPVPLLVTVLLAVLTAWGIAFAIKITRIIASFLTMGGGSAA